MPLGVLRLRTVNTQRCLGASLAGTKSTKGSKGPKGSKAPEGKSKSKDPGGRRGFGGRLLGLAATVPLD